MTSACWIYAKHAAYTNISFKQITASYASTRYCLDKIIPEAFPIQKLLLFYLFIYWIMQQKQRAISL